MTDHENARLPRSSGILLHPTCLPGRFGIGDVGPAALEFADALADAGQRRWQILPLGPTGYGNSPYQSYSSFAGNPLLISPEALARDGLLREEDWCDFPTLPESRVDFDAVIPAKDRLVRTAFQRFRRDTPEFVEFTGANASWLDDYALFMASKDHHGGSAWWCWEPALARREPAAVRGALDRFRESILYYKFAQWVFARQWRKLREHCDRRGVSLVGDLPIFVARDSADVWARPELFWLDPQGNPTVVAGVPPDDFEPVKGQLWGNPLYRWPVHAADGYAWWVSRIKAQTDRVDLIRLDHFRGFEAYWEVPADAETAAAGSWKKGPGAPFLQAVHDALGGLPLLAEDLGDISKEVYELRDAFHLPGMRVIQFGLGGGHGTDFHLPYRYVNHCVAYTGTHDNETTYGWYAARASGTAEERARHNAQRAYARRLLGSTGEEFHWDAIRALLGSVADTTFVPVQDLLGLGGSARMNVPGNPRGNWTWRLRAGQVRPQTWERLADLTAVSGRWNGVVPARLGALGQ